jgi:hypothetical protein
MAVVKTRSTQKLAALAELAGKTLPAACEPLEPYWPSGGAYNIWLVTPEVAKYPLSSA